MLSYAQFRVLDYVRRHENPTQRSIANDTDLSIGTVNAALRNLVEMGLVSDDGIVTGRGMDALAPYRVDNAIIMAAGLSSRFAPISYEKPKGVLNVRGEVLIERQIRQLHEAGIEDVIVVVGYKKEEFFYLEDKFGVTIVVNPDYKVRNNNSTIKRVEQFLENSYICSSDDYFMDNPFEEYVYESYYSAVFEEGQTGEYCLAMRGKNNRIVGVTVGGENSWVMLGHAYWNREYSREFCRILNEIYEKPDTAAKLWEDIYIEYIDRLPMVVRKYPHGAIWEFDSLAELKEFDADFIQNVDSSIMDNICSVLNCERREIEDIAPIKQGLTNLSCRFRVGDNLYVYRQPGSGTGEIINRASEAESERIAYELGIDRTFIYEDPDEGWKISRFIEGCSVLDYADKWQVDEAMRIARTLHSAGAHSEFEYDLFSQAMRIEGLLRTRGDELFGDYEEIKALAYRANELAKEHGSRRCLCHNDFYSPNFLVKDKSIDLVDWEYSGMSDYASDLGTFVCCAPNYGYEDALCVLRSYFMREPDDTELLHCISYIAVASFYCMVWALYKESAGGVVADYLHLWYKNAKMYGNKAAELAAQLG